MDDETTNEHPDDAGSEPEPSPWPRRQVYFVAVEWLDQPHRPESPERLARVIRHAIEHGHTPGPDAPPASFVVRVKADDAASEVQGVVQPHHHAES